MDHVSSQHEHDAVHADRHDRYDALGGGARRGLFLALVLLATLTCSALGAWQLQRRAWKLDLIERVESRIDAPPQALPSKAAWPRVNARDDEYRRVRVAGVFDNDRETLVHAVTERGGGYWVMTPLRTGDGTILINRGFVPPARRAPATRQAGQLRGSAVVTGLMRMSEPEGGFLRANQPARDLWYSRDVAAIARALGLEQAAPFFIDADATPNPGGYPVGGLTIVAFRNPHLVYALTWFALAGLGAAATWLLLRDRP